ncbi:unnamed protein product [Prorocentrum cordatum]|uniref:Altered inheritance of mitochondria protein 24, mitochondrial n=1 Tax=Prorocentrum cordatum TaxID=2364126 RepID=A0ABN9Q0J7_9DINO|nr:unnamed protein product [Polarella glacialis]
MNENQEYLFAQPGKHSIGGRFTRHCGTHKLPTNDALVHGSRCILMVEQGFLGLASDNGQPVLLPPGIRVWTSDARSYKRATCLDQHMVSLGPYTLIAVDEGYAAVAQNNRKRHVCPGGATHLLIHKLFEKFLRLKIQTEVEVEADQGHQCR